MENDIQRLTPQERSLSLKRNKEAFLLARKNRAEKLFELKQRTTLLYLSMKKRKFMLI